MIDLDAYFKRIGFPGARAPSLEALDGIVLRHVKSIPFENLDVLLGRPIDLDDAAIQKKLIHEKRGGYCFEQNTLLLAVLKQLGFEARPLSARVRYQRPRDFTPARTHLLIRVEVDGVARLADVGAGAMSPTKSLTLDELGSQVTPHETRRLLRENGLIYHQALLGSQWAESASSRSKKCRSSIASSRIGTPARTLIRTFATSCWSHAPPMTEAASPFSTVSSRFETARVMR